MTDCAVCGQDVDFERMRIISCNLPADGINPEIGIHCQMCLPCFRKVFAQVKWWTR